MNTFITYATILYYVVRNRSETYSITGYTTDEELVAGFNEFVENSDVIDSESKAVIYCIRETLEMEGEKP